MDFDLTEEQRLLKESVDRLMADAYGDFEKRKRHQEHPQGYSPELWAKYAEMGLLALPFTEEQGGFGGGPVETMLVMEAIGRGLAVEPYLATVVLGGGFLRLAGREDMIPSLAEGSATLAFAHTERQSRDDLFDVATTARRTDNGWVLDGSKSVVLHGDTASHLIVSARTSGNRRDRAGISLFLLPADTAGVSRRGYPTQDGLRAAEITLEQVKLPAGALLGAEGEALPLMERVVDAALAALCAEAVGAMEALHELTIDYLKQRKQFNTTIGSFQAVQHRAADMLVALEQARSMAMYAAMMAEHPDAAVRRPAIAAAKALVNRSADLIGKEAIQLHGGIAMTMEYKAGHYFKRLTMLANQFGDTDRHLRVVAEAGGLDNAA
ncbi:pimeloyl-CoA dehydrogenase small subunit [Roseomonas sp. M0104]|uniref:Pimeloyl-CoA dehydrogenase small subunit n=1 Tax=Teichococcus coralli TaxID=2545983 RepID=A0A845BFX7_9PROT|nr:acyl-CoA dehydrogenase family protein [Pseudoroseomonas coralli]MXP64132.1 pimeloyl-CoA dehydrogenase small subunit [Pseudoroseomonas coralli]